MIILNAEFLILDTTMYSFSVRLHEDTVIDDDPCVFGTVDLNIGDGYDAFSGKSHLFLFGKTLCETFLENIRFFWNFV